MEKYFLIAFILFLFCINSQAQGNYSEKKLKQLSQDDLDLYMVKAKKLKKAGGILLISGPISGLSGIALAAHSWAGGAFFEYQLGLGMIFYSAGAILSGIPIYSIGSSRVKLIKRISDRNNSQINLTPTTFYNSQTQNFYPGITMSLRF